MVTSRDARVCARRACSAACRHGPLKASRGSVWPITLSNPPLALQLDLAHWQIVWRFSDYRTVGLLRTQGAIALSLGSPSGAPVRLVDTFTSDGVPGGERRVAGCFAVPFHMSMATAGGHACSCRTPGFTSGAAAVY